MTTRAREQAVLAARRAFPHKVLAPGDRDYDLARQVFNATIDRHPALIVRCTDAADVAAAVGLARAYELVVAVRGGGHSVAGFGVCDGGLVVDLSGMRNVRIDPRALVVRSEGGATWGELDEHAQVAGLATPGGIISSTGVAGLTLGGGVGWLVRKHGLAADNLVSAEIVTADGRHLRASAAENPDLLWALRGGGGNFGVVTNLEHRLHPVGCVLGGMVLHPLKNAQSVLRFYRDFIADAPRELTASASLVTSDEGSAQIALLVCYAGLESKGEMVTRPLRSFATPLRDSISSMPYVRMQRLIDAAFPRGRRHYWKSTFLAELSDDAIQLIVECAAGVPSPHSAILIENYGGAAGRPDVQETAYPHRQERFNLHVVASWIDAIDDQQNVAWARQLFERIQPYASDGVYVNFLGTEGEDRVRAAYGQNYERLAVLKSLYDPMNLFRHNQNIKPAPASSKFYPASGTPPRSSGP